MKNGVLWLFFLGLAACSDGRVTINLPGAEKGACYENQTCNTGLVCSAGVCASANTDGGVSGAAGDNAMLMPFGQPDGSAAEADAGATSDTTDAALSDAAVGQDASQHLTGDLFVGYWNAVFTCQGVSGPARLWHVLKNASGGFYFGSDTPVGTTPKTAVVSGVVLTATYTTGGHEYVYTLIDKNTFTGTIAGDCAPLFSTTDPGPALVEGKRCMLDTATSVCNNI